MHLVKDKIPRQQRTTPNTWLLSFTMLGDEQQNKSGKNHVHVVLNSVRPLKLKTLPSVLLRAHLC
jgi:hypothetical protein